MYSPRYSTSLWCAGDLVLLAALLVQEEHALVIGDTVVLHVHRDDCSRPGRRCRALRL